MGQTTRPITQNKEAKLKAPVTKNDSPNLCLAQQLPSNQLARLEAQPTNKDNNNNKIFPGKEKKKRKKRDQFRNQEEDIENKKEKEKKKDRLLERYYDFVVYMCQIKRTILLRQIQ